MIITIKDGIADDVALRLVLEVVSMGKISQDTKGHQYYCWCSTWDHEGELYDVWVRQNYNQPSFIVSKNKSNEAER